MFACFVVCMLWVFGALLFWVVGLVGFAVLFRFAFCLVVLTYGVLVVCG